MDQNQAPAVTQPSKPVNMGLGAPLVVDMRYVTATKQSLEVLRTMVATVLERDRDYGNVPGVPRDFLWEPGADQIINAFNCFAGQRRILHLTDDENKVAAVVEVPLISRASNTEVGSGIGASSTNETKHGYRWVDDPAEWGYPDSVLDTLKYRLDKDSGVKTYRIANPDRAELLNVIIKQAAKRAKIDAAKSLPAVSGVLREMFDTKGKRGGKGYQRAEKSGDGQKDQRMDDWSRFWGATRSLSLTSDQVHEMLGVKSMTEWLDQNKGQTLDDALKILTSKVQSNANPPTQPSPPKASKSAASASKVKPRAWWDKVTPDNVKSYDHLEGLAKDYAGITAKQMYAELGGGNRNDMTITPWEAFLALKEHFVPDLPEEK
jgi:hypothetical protein